MSFTKHIYHIVFRTKNSVPAICVEHENVLYRYIWGICKNEHVFLHRINGMPDHIHLLVEIPASLAVSAFVQKLKQSVSLFLRNHKIEFPFFVAWAEGYASLTYAEKDIPVIKNYIANQKEHHLKCSYFDEIKILLDENGIKYDEKYL